MEIVLFEGKGCENFYPLNLLRGTFDIKCGVFSARERLELITKKKISLFTTKEKLSLIKSIYPENQVNKLKKTDTFYINSRVLLSKKQFNAILKIPGNNWKLTHKDTLVAAMVSKERIREKFDVKNFNFASKLKKITFESLKSDSELMIMNYAWDVIKYFDFMLPEDLKLISDKKLTPKKKYRNLINQSRIFICKNVKVFPDSVLDASEGDIYIDKNVIIEPFTYIKGPAYIGKDSIIKSGAKLYGPNYIGENSRIAGEVSHSIFHAFVNKSHDGFIGHTYACEFINFGADTVTSNLKNNYSKVSVSFEGKNHNTGMQFLGSLIGDHTKFGINTMINTGTIIGIFANIAGSGFPPKFLKSFSWNIYGRDVSKYKIEEALDTAKIVMGRRGLKMNKQYENLIRSLYDKL
jgi:UDP-N-acetylglucosamine diphosphorylase/glucosamine-1-phosphate N-acetyltransferase